MSSSEQPAGSNLNNEPHETIVSLTTEAQEILEDVEAILARNRITYSGIGITQFHPKTIIETTTENGNNIATTSSNSSNNLNNKDSSWIEIRITTPKNDSIELSNQPSSSSNGRVTRSGHKNNLKRKSLDNIVIVINDVDFSESNPPKKPRLQQHKCSVCLVSTVLRIPTATPCGHVFCNSCIIRSYHNRKLCPLCMKKFRLSKLQKLHFS